MTTCHVCLHMSVCDEGGVQICNSSCFPCKDTERLTYVNLNKKTSVILGKVATVCMLKCHVDSLMYLAMLLKPVMLFSGFVHLMNLVLTERRDERTRVRMSVTTVWVTQQIVSDQLNLVVRGHKQLP